MGGVVKLKCWLSDFRSSPVPTETKSPGCLVASREQDLSMKIRVNSGSKTKRVIESKSWTLL